MRKFISTKPVMTAAIIFSICVITLFIFNACGKMEHLHESGTAESSVRVKFFTMPASTNPIVKAIAESIRRQDKQRDFVPELSEKHGHNISQTNQIGRLLILHRSKTVQED